MQASGTTNWRVPLIDKCIYAVLKKKNTKRYVGTLPVLYSYIYNLTGKWAFFFIPLLMRTQLYMLNHVKQGPKNTNTH